MFVEGMYFETLSAAMSDTISGRRPTALRTFERQLGASFDFCPCCSDVGIDGGCQDGS